VLHLACLDQTLNGTSGFFDGRIGIDAMLVEQVNGVSLQTLQRAFDDLLDVVGATVRCRPLAIVAGIGLESELGRDHDIFAEGSESFAHDLFIDERAIHFGSIEEGDTALHSGANELDRFALLRGGAKTEAQAHTSEAEC